MTEEGKRLLKAARTRVALTQRGAADLLEKKSLNSYFLKENGVTDFTPHEMALMANATKMTLDEFNEIFFEGELHFRSEK